MTVWWIIITIIIIIIATFCCSSGENVYSFLWFLLTVRTRKLWNECHLCVFLFLIVATDIFLSKLRVLLRNSSVANNKIHHYFKEKKDDDNSAFFRFPLCCILFLVQIWILCTNNNVFKYIFKMAIVNNLGKLYQ